MRDTFVSTRTTLKVDTTLALLDISEQTMTLRAETAIDADAAQTLADAVSTVTIPGMTDESASRFSASLASAPSDPVATVKAKAKAKDKAKARDDDKEKA